MKDSETLDFAAGLLERQIEELDGQIDGLRSSLKFVEQTQRALRSTLSVIQPRIEELKALEGDQLTIDFSEDETPEAVE